MGIGVDCVSSLWFLRFDFARSLLWYLCPLQSLCPALSSGVNHNATARMAASPISVPCRQPDLGVQHHHGLVLFGRQPQLPHSMGREQGWGHLRATPWFCGILVHPSPPVQVYLWTTSFMGRIFPGLHTG